MASRGRNTTVRDQDRAVIRRGKPPCALCGEPIDYSLHHLDPMAFTVDHIIPLARGGLDVLANKQAAHRVCNRAKGTMTMDEWLAQLTAAATPAGPRVYVTARTW